MIKIHILTIQHKYIRGFNDFHPLLKWKKEFLNQGITFVFFKNHLNKKIYDADILMIDSRYSEMIIKGHYAISSNKIGKDDSFMINFISEAKKYIKKIVLFDTADGGSSTSFHMTPYVDVHLKKQMYLDKNRYLDYHEYNFMPWLPESEGIQEKKNPKMKFTPLKKEDTSKLKLAWNIGMCDYRKYPLKKYYPLGNFHLFNKLVKHLEFKKPSNERAYILSLRGSSNRYPSYDYQRNMVLKVLNTLKFDQLIVGGKIPFNQYIEEQENSKMSVSPFGWGEICYRDFESIINGCVLIKPEMNHLDTYPQFYTKDTYVPFSWDGKDLLKIIEQVNANYENYIETIKNAQSLLKTSQADASSFIKHFYNNIID